MTDIAARNRQIKKILEDAFGRGTVTVRGTTSGTARVTIDHTPLSGEAALELHRKCARLLTGIAPGCKIHFNMPLYSRHFRSESGAVYGLRWDDDQWEPYQAV